MRLGVTRAVEQLTALSERASSKGIEVVPLPLTQQLNLPFTWPNDLAPKDIDWLFFTSATRARSFFDRLKEIGVEISTGTRVAVVGEKTAEAVGSFGYQVHFQPSEQTGEALFTRFVISRQTGKLLLYARGKVINSDPQTLFANAPYRLIELICYETVRCKVDVNVVDGFTGSDYILFSAPSAVRAYHEQFGQPKARPIAIGPTTAHAMSEQGWTDPKVMKQPDIDRALEYV